MLIAVLQNYIGGEVISCQCHLCWQAQCAEAKAAWQKGKKLVLYPWSCSTENEINTAP